MVTRSCSPTCDYYTSLTKTTGICEDDTHPLKVNLGVPKEVIIQRKAEL